MTGKQLEAVRQELDDVRREIKQRIKTNPWDFDGREHLWMRHEDLRSTLRNEGLTP